MRTILATIFILLSCLAGSQVVFAGKLSSVRESVREEEPKAKSKKKEKKKSRRSSDRDDDSGINWLSIGLSLFTQDTASQNSQSLAASQAYQEPVYVLSTTIPASTIPGGLVSHELGNANVVPVSSPPRPAVDTSDAWFGRFTAFGGSDFDTLDQYQFALLAQIPHAFGLDVAVHSFRESTPSISDQLWLGDANVVIEPIFGDLRARIGVGFNWLHDNVGTDYGINLTGGFDLDLSQVLMLTGEIDLGGVGEADLLHAQLTLGYQLGPAELFGGYNYYRIGGTKLDGAIAGLRFRF